MKVGIIGLGIMGYRIAKNLAKDDILNYVYDRTPAKAMEFKKEFENVEYFNDPTELAKSSDVVITILSDDNAVTSIIKPLIPIASNKIIIDMSTISPITSYELAKEINSKGYFYDAPIIGTSIAVENKSIVILVGGPYEKFETVKEILTHTSNNIVYMGANGFGLKGKLVNNLLIGVYMAALSEAFNFGLDLGLTKEQIGDILSKLSSARSPTSEIKIPKIINGDYSTQFSVKNIRKDLDIIINISQHYNSLVPLASLTENLYKITESLGYSSLDFSSIFEMYRKLTLK
ncbi:NAD(P)-dependent oxidoreductase [Caldisphaera sp.]|uniref:NAD(P)-dependent oxidoreductase n=1 Tax=Caldisphaera sp. TaxID=2060322 RepID=UPI003D0E0651